ncbi:MAG: T9SS type A sorting domain-containing protein [Bacteroidia bacterium]|nr:T9SS type A sorting domain-containing protein [Bacteroidia bacterium]
MKDTLFSKSMFIWFVIQMILISLPLSAQINEDDPLRNSRNLIKEQEVILTYSEISVNSPADTRLKGLVYKKGSGTSLTEIRNQSSQTTGSNTLNPAIVATTSGNFFGEDYGDGIVHAYIGKDGALPGVYFRVDLLKGLVGTHASLTPTNGIFWAGNPAVFNNNSQIPRVEMTSGNYDDDLEDELVIVYNAPGDQLRLQVYDLSLTRSGNNVTFQLNVKEDFIFAPVNNDVRLLKNFSIAEFDMNTDGLDELAIAYREGSNIVLRVYELNQQGNLTIKQNSILFNPSLVPCAGSGSFNFTSLSLDLASGDLSPELPGEELVLAAHFDLTNGVGSAGLNQGLYVFPIGSFYTNSGAQVIELNWCDGTPFYFTNSDFLFSDEQIAVSVATGDLDGDLDDEVVLGTNSRVFVLNGATGTYPSGNKHLEFNQLTTFNIPSSYTNQQIGSEAKFADNFIAVGNIDPLVGNFGSEFRAEILVGKNFPLISDPINNDISQHFKLTVYGFNESGSQGAINWTPVIKAEKDMIAQSTSGLKVRNFSVSFGDVDGGSVILGTPNRSNISEILNPSIILNAPPTHFDVFDQTSYDVCNLYAAGEAVPSSSVNHFFSEYEEVVNESFSFSSNFTTDWAVSTSVEAGFSAAGFDLGAKMSASYGERFSKINASSISKTITQVRKATQDDELLAYLVDYSIFEYPVYRLGEITPITHVIVVQPKNVRPTFTGARSPRHTYKNTHQFGNLFSYPTNLNELDLPPGSITNVYEGLKSQEIKKGSGFGASFSVSQTEARAEGVQSEISTNTTVGANVGGAFKGFGINVSVEGSYSTSDIQNRSAKYQDSVSMRGFLGAGEGSSIPGDYPYAITPLVYWNEDGTLVLDYLVDITKTGFWQNFYNSYDPAFLLLDPHKTQKDIEAKETYNNTDRYRTRDIIFDKRPTPGEAITISARIHNYGFADIPTTSLDVAFYYVDPDGTDTLESIGLVILGEGIQGRDNGFDRSIISIPWNIPANLGPNTKVVAILDPSDNLPNEIHDYPNGNGVSNNIGWTCLFNPNCTLSEDEAIFYPGGVTSTEEELLAQLQINAFPNPFQDILNLDIELESPQDLTIELFDLQGRLLYQKEKPNMIPGKSRMDISTAGWPEGMYLYKISGDGFHKAGRIVLKR